MSLPRLYTRAQLAAKKIQRAKWRKTRAGKASVAASRAKYKRSELGKLASWRYYVGKKARVA